MTRMREYEFDVETLDIDDVTEGHPEPEILDHWHAESLSAYPEKILRSCEQSATYFRLCVVRDDMREAEGIVRRSWAHLIPGDEKTGLKPVMEAEFKDAGGAVIGRVPARIMDQIRQVFPSVEIGACE